MSVRGLGERVECVDNGFEVCATRTIEFHSRLVIGMGEHKKERNLVLCAVMAYRMNQACTETTALEIWMNGQVVDEEFGID